MWNYLISISCNGDDECKGKEVSCNSNSNCNIQCMGKSSCDSAGINGQQAVSLSVQCGIENEQEPSDSCKSADIDCDVSAICSVSCFGKTVCGDAIIDGEKAGSASLVQMLPR